MSSNLLSKYLHSKNHTRLLSKRIFLWQRINEPWLAFHLTGLSAATSCCFHLYPVSKKMSSRKATGRRHDQITDREDWTKINSWRTPIPPSASPHPRARPRPGHTRTYVLSGQHLEKKWQCIFRKSARTQFKLRVRTSLNARLSLVDEN